MNRAFAINGSPRKGKGNTAMILDPFIQGMKDGGYEVELIYASDLKIKFCNCNDMYCWYRTPGKCCFDDDMTALYPRIAESDTLILATPVYVPLPGEMQNVINRLCPLMVPRLEFRDQRTRARMREHVLIRRIVLVSTGGWWEKGNFDTVTRIVRELAEDASVEFAGAVIRPHAFAMHQEGKLTNEGKAIAEATRRAGVELARDGAIRPETLEDISRPLIPEAQLRSIYNGMVAEQR